MVPTVARPSTHTGLVCFATGVAMLVAGFGHRTGATSIGLTTAVTLRTRTVHGTVVAAVVGIKGLLLGWSQGSVEGFDSLATAFHLRTALDVDGVHAVNTLRHSQLFHAIHAQARIAL